MAMTLTTLSSWLAPAGQPLEPIDVIEDRFAGLRSLPAFGTAGLYAVMVVAGLAFCLSIWATKRPRYLDAARSAAYATCALIVFDLLLLAYAFLSHDYRLRYVARYSDRSMSVGYLLTALWGGQDGSLLWWLFLLSANTAACVLWMKGKYKELQPYIIATLMTIMIFFVIIMGFSANPFSESIAGARVDGEGLNPLLQDFYMIIHPPSLYTGFVGCSVPFAFGIAALATGRLGEEWIYAVRRWMLFAWIFLSIGNTLGMAWAYTELGWGGHWAWDPVENAAFMPWLSASAFVHSIMIQERWRMLKVWNIVLLSVTFFMTIWGTFLTRSGMISSVHAFAQSNIGVYFIYFLVTIATVTTALTVYRLPELKNVSEEGKPTEMYRAEVGKALIRVLAMFTVVLCVIRWQTPKMAPVGALAFVTVIGLIVFGANRLAHYFPNQKRGAIEALLSREAAFVANNWILLAMQAFIAITTAFPLISESITGEKITVGPAFYNAWMVPLGLSLFALMGVGPLLGWRKTSDSALRKAFFAPGITMFAVVAMHFAIGKKIGFPAIVESDPIYSGALGSILAKASSVFPVVATGLAAFNVAVIIQEYSKAVLARMRTHRDENGLTAVWALVAKSRRRYGGYIVHLGIVAMFLGFTGGAYKVDQEFSLSKGDVVEYHGYQITYLGPRRVNDDPAKMEIYVDLAVKKGNTELRTMTPARFVYRRQQMPTSEVDIHVGPFEDLYIAPGSVNPETKTATIHVFVNPLEVWIWLGALILVFGAAVSTWPEAALQEVGIGAYLRTAGATAASLVLGVALAITPARANAQQSGTSSLHAGTVEMKSPEERRLFNQLRCLCGGCDRLPLSACVCDWAKEARQEMSSRLAAGESVDRLIDDYVAKHGTDAKVVPPNTGFLKSIWLVPSVLIVVGAVSAVFVVRRWTSGARNVEPKPPRAGEPGKPLPKDEYDDKLDKELRDLDDRSL